MYFRQNHLSGLGDDPGITVKQYGSSWASYQSPPTDAAIKVMQSIMNKFPGISVSVNGLVTATTAGWVQTICHRFLFDAAGNNVTLVDRSSNVVPQGALLAADIAAGLSRLIGSGNLASAPAQAELVAKNPNSVATTLSQLLPYLPYYKQPALQKKVPSSSGGGKPVASSPPAVFPPGFANPDGSVFEQLTQNKLALGGIVIAGAWLIGSRMKKGKRGGARMSRTSRRSRR